MYAGLTRDDCTVLALIRKCDGAATNRDFRYHFGVSDVEDSARRLEEAEFIRIVGNAVRVNSAHLSYVDGKKVYALTLRGWAYLNFGHAENSECMTVH